MIEVAEDVTQVRAVDFLEQARAVQAARAQEYDQPGGERSMEKVVTLFNTITGAQLTESDGWLFMVLLKIVRDQSRVDVHADSCRDMVSYASLYAESRSAGK